MTISGVENYTPAATALSLLRQPTEAGRGSGVAGSRAQGPAVLYGGSLSSDGTNPFDAIRKILSESKANVPDAAREAGVANLQNALGRFAEAGFGFEFDVDGKPFPGAAAAALGDKNIGFIDDYSKEVVTTDEEALAKLAESAEYVASRPSSSVFSKIVNEAYKAGKVELIPAEEFGIESQHGVTFHFSNKGEFLGSSYSSKNNLGITTVGDLYETRLIQQEDGSRIDIETGRYASYVIVGGRDYIATFDRPAEYAL